MKFQLLELTLSTESQLTNNIARFLTMRILNFVLLSIF